MKKGKAQWSRIYEDHGCEFAPSCLSCPLPVCAEEWTAKKRLEEATARGVVARTTDTLYHKEKPCETPSEPKPKPKKFPLARSGPH